MPNSPAPAGVRRAVPQETCRAATSVRDRIQNDDRRRLRGAGGGGVGCSVGVGYGMSVSMPHWTPDQLPSTYQVPLEGRQTVLSAAPSVAS
jgi:hypothetical protein